MTTDMKSFVVTGGNKGIGLAIVKGLLEKGYFVFLGSRDVPRGDEAAQSLGEEYKDKVQVVQLDVTDASSVASAVDAVKAKCGETKLHGLVNNAGGAGGMKWMGHENHQGCIELNLYSAERVTSAFLPVLSSEGRVVMVGSGAAPSYVAKCSAERQAMLIDPAVTWDQLKAFLEEADKVSATAPEDPAAAFGAVGLGDGASYGMSKAVLASYAMVVARENPGMKVNSCSPGFIETDLTRPFATAMGKTPQEMGMKTAEQGATCPLYLAVGDPPTSSGEAWFFGSDALRSPLDKYREPGDPPYTGGVSKESSHGMSTAAEAVKAKEEEDKK